MTEPIGAALLNLAAAALPWWQEWTGWRIESKARAGRCLRCHRAALDAEAAGRFRRADFYWRSLHRQFRSMQRSGAWAAVEADLAAQGVDLAGRPLAAVVAEELILDSNLAILDACLPHEYLTPRAWQHVRYVDELAKQSGLPGEWTERALGPRLLAQLDKSVEAKRWKDARRAGEILVKTFPARRAYPEALARVHFAEAIEGVTAASADAGHTANAKVLARAIVRIDALRQQSPRELGLLMPLAELRRFRAVQLANAGCFSDAYLENEKAASHNPDDDQIAELRASLAQTLTNLAQQVSTAMASLGPNQQLNPKGQQLAAQARAGVTPGLTYAKSDEAQRLAADHQAARARSIWRAIGLGSLPGSDEVPLRLLAGVYSIFPAVKDSPAQAHEIWLAHASADSALAGLDAGMIAGFVRARALSEPWEAPDTEAPPEAVKPTTAMQLPHAAPGWRDLEPLGPWFFSLDAPWGKVAALVAIVLVAAVGWRASAEREDRRVRGEAYAQARGAMAANDYERVMTAAGRFLDVHLAVPDTREPEVRRMYNESLVRWFNAQQEAPPRDHPYLARYRRLFPDTARAQP